VRVGNSSRAREIRQDRMVVNKREEGKVLDEQQAAASLSPLFPIKPLAACLGIWAELFAEAWNGKHSHALLTETLRGDANIGAGTISVRRKMYVHIALSIRYVYLLHG